MIPAPTLRVLPTRERVAELLSDRAQRAGVALGADQIAFADLEQSLARAVGLEVERGPRAHLLACELLIQRRERAAEARGDAGSSSESPVSEAAALIRSWSLLRDAAPGRGERIADPQEVIRALRGAPRLRRRPRVQRWLDVVQDYEDARASRGLVDASTARRAILDGLGDPGLAPAILGPLLRGAQAIELEVLSESSASRRALLNAFARGGCQVTVRLGSPSGWSWEEASRSRLDGARGWVAALKREGVGPRLAHRLARARSGTNMGPDSGLGAGGGLSPGLTWVESDEPAALAAEAHAEILRRLEQGASLDRIAVAWVSGEGRVAAQVLMGRIRNESSTQLRVWTRRDESPAARALAQHLLELARWSAAGSRDDFVGAGADALAQLACSWDFDPRPLLDAPEDVKEAWAPNTRARAALVDELDALGLRPLSPESAGISAPLKILLSGLQRGSASFSDWLGRLAVWAQLWSGTIDPASDPRAALEEWMEALREADECLGEGGGERVQWSPGDFLAWLEQALASRAGPLSLRSSRVLGDRLEFWAAPDLIGAEVDHLVVLGFGAGGGQGRHPAAPWLDERDASELERALGEAIWEPSAAREARVFGELLECAGQSVWIGGSGSGPLAQELERVLGHGPRRLAVLGSDRGGGGPTDAAPPRGRRKLELEPALAERAAARAGYAGPRWLSSVSALESYAACPFRFFAERVLGLEDTAAVGPQVSAAELGRLRHELAATAFEALAAASLLPLGLVGSPEREWQVASEAALAKLQQRTAQLRRAGGAVAAQPQFWRIERERLLDALARLMERERARASEGWVPEAFEAPFGDGQNPFELPAPEGGEGGPRTLALRGRLDRVDRGPAGRRRVVDYKSTTRRIRADHLARLDLQLPLYAAWLDSQESGTKGEGAASRSEAIFISLLDGKRGGDGLAEVAAKDPELEARLALQAEKGTVAAGAAALPTAATLGDAVWGYARAIAAGRYDVAPSQGCRSCPHRLACRVDEDAQ